VELHRPASSRLITIPLVRTIPRGSLSGSKVFAVSAIDKAGNMSSAVSGSVALDNAAPTISSVLLANGNGTAGRADNGDQVIVTRRPSWNGLWNETVFSGDADGTWSARKC
jgi:microcompartment protein CcmK/EutM